MASYLNQKLGEIGAWAVPTRPIAPKAPVKPIVKPPQAPAISASLAAQMRAMNPSMTATWGWTPEQGASYWGTPQVEAPSYQGASGFDYAPIAPYQGPSSSLLESQQTEDLGAMSSSMTSRIRQALVDLGLSDQTQLGADAAKYVDAPTLEAAKANKYSLFQQIANSSERATAQARAQLAARGMLSSGQLTKATQDIVNQAEQQRYAGVREFTGSVGDLVSQYAQRQRDWASKIAEARFMEAQYRAAAGGGGGGGGGGGYGIDAATGRGYDSPERGGRPGEYADLPVRVGWNPARNSDAEYDMSGATRTAWGFIGPNGVRYDENGRVI